MPTTRPELGFGLGLRPTHYQQVLEQLPAVDWFEVISENYMVPGGKPLYYLDKIREHYPMVMHGVSMSLGSSDPLNREYLNALKQLIERVQPQWVSDHLCWTGVDAHNAHDLLPLPYTNSTVKHVADRISQVQDILGRQILLENLSSYVTFEESEMTEWDFITSIAERADCLLLLDVNNVYVSACNHNYAAHDFFNGVPMDRVWQIHLAGHTQSADGSLLIDTHDQPVGDPVWSLYQDVIQQHGFVNTMIERDGNIPPFDELFAELETARLLALPDGAVA